MEIVLAMLFLSAISFTRTKDFKEKLPVLSFSIKLQNTWVQLETPDLTTTNPDCYPSLKPKWKFTDWEEEGLRCECRWSFRLDWFFHFVFMWN